MAMSGASPNHSPKPGVSSPWSQIVAAAAAPPSSSAQPPVVESAMVNSVPAEDSNSGAGHNVNTGKRPAWNKPSNGVSSSVMGAETWPALSESARVSVKSTSPSPSPSLSESSKGSSEVSPLQGSGSVVPSPQRHVRDNASANNTVQAHQKSFKRSNSNTSSNGGNLLPQMSVPQSSVAAAAGPHNHNSSPKEHQPRAGFVPNDHPPQRNSYRHRNGGGPHQRGDYHHHNYGGRRDQDRGHDWNNHRNFNGRDNYMSPRIVPRFIRPQPPPNHAQFYPPGPSPIRPYGGSYGYHELHPQMVYVPPPALESFRGVSYMSPMPPNAMYFPPPDTQLHAKIVNQINYYFSNENLVKDLFLRRKMDDQGWVPISLIAGFKKVKFLTDNIQIVLDAVRTSSVVEVQGDKIRRRNDWRRWIMPADQLPNVRGSQIIGQLAEQVQSIALETTNNDDAGVLDAASQNRPFGDLNSQYMLSTSEGTGSQVGIQVSDHSISARN